MEGNFQGKNTFIILLPHVIEMLLLPSMGDVNT